ncbi:MAG: hypothetical protein KF768_11225 [Phycisphaeraceae bacterium]|nr:hypothetical protein [Phycisphaeraceae bacterium]
MILFHAADLIWASKIKGAAEALGIPARPVRNEEMLRARLADSDVRALMVDLDQPEVALALIRLARQPFAGSDDTVDSTSPASVNRQTGEACGARIRVLAYGPHVNVAAFEAARAAGADTAMARGGLDARLSQVLRSLAEPPPPAQVAP